MVPPRGKPSTAGEGCLRQPPPLSAKYPDPPAMAPAAASSSERRFSRAILALILLALAVRVPLLINAGPGSDEVSHLHSAWAVAHGQVPYRDFWQMHPPLLYYLMAPVFALMGEDVRIIYVGRALMLLCILLILFQLYRMARGCFDALTGLLAVLLLSYLLLWWPPAYSFRPDTPQTLLVLMSLWRFMRAWERRNRGEFLASGALLGVAFWLLTKTLFPLVGLVLVFVVSSGLNRSAAALRDNLTRLLFFLAAFAVPVFLGAALLWIGGALPNFLRWGVLNNFRFPDRFSAFPKMAPDVHFVFLALASVGAVLAVTRMIKRRVVDEFQLTPLLAGSVTAAVYLFLMPAPYAQSALPFLPLAAMYGADVLRRVIARALPPRPAKREAFGGAEASFAQSPARFAWGGLAALLLYGACALPMQALLAQMPPLSDHWPGRRQTIRYVLALTSPEDSVFDAYGLYLFRPHATYYYRLSEGVLMWLRSGFVPEIDIMNDLRRNHCKVVIFSPPMRRLPPNLLRFILSHYVSTGFQADPEPLVAGKVLHRADLAGDRATVSLIASAEYAVRPRGGTPRVYIDGQLYRAPMFLAQGDHQIVVDGEFRELAIFYSRVLAVSLRRSDRSATDRPDQAVRPRSKGDDD